MRNESSAGSQDGHIALIDGRRIRTRLFIMMALQIGIWGAWAPKLFPYMSSLGFSAVQQALVGSCWGIASIIGIFFSNQFADRVFSGERILAISHLMGGLFLLGAANSTGFPVFFACFLGYSLLYVPTLSLTNSLSFAHLKDPARDFGKVRMGGTIGWVIASWPFVFLLGAQSDASQLRWILIVAAIISFALAAYALTLPRTPPERKPASDALAWREALGHLRNPAICVLFAVTFIDSIVHNGYFVVSDAFLTNRVGIAGNLSMLVLSIGQVAEVVTMGVLGLVLTRLGWRNTMIIGVLGHAARFLIFAFFPDSVGLIIAVQLLHGICYAFFFATVYIYVDHVFPSDVRVSAQGLFNLLILGVGSVIASFLFPMLVEMMTVSSGGKAYVDYTALFLVPTGLSLLGAIILAVAFRPANFGPDRREANV